MDIKLITPLPFNEDYSALHAGAIAGLEEEIDAVRRKLRSWGGDKPVRVLSGDLVGAEGDTFLYSFYLPRSIFPPEFTAVEVSTGSGRARGFVEEVEDRGRVLVVSLTEDLKGNPMDAEITFDPTQILESVKARLMDIAPGRSHSNMETVLRTLGFVEASVGDAPLSHPCMDERGANAGQRAAVSRAVGSELCLVFGPPGTGKTSCTLGPLVAELAETQNKRVLVAAHTNTALDTAMEAVVQCISPALINEGNVVRFGKIRNRFAHLGISVKDASAKQSRSQDKAYEPRIAELEEQLKELVSDEQLHQHNKANLKRFGGVDGRIGLLIWRVQMLRRNCPPGVSRGLTKLEIQARELRGEIEKNSSNAVKSAKIVGATLSSVALNYSDFGEFDVVVIDEGSMASLPQVMVAASKSKSQVIVLGDPQQLPPVVVANTRKAQTYLGRNLYAQLGLEDPSIEDERRPMLTIQYRMAPPIREIVSKLFYADKLEDGENVLSYLGENVILIDTSNTDAESSKKGDSRINFVHSQIVVNVVRECFESGERDIGVITPFNSQSKLIRQELDAAIPGYFRGGNFVGTVHRAQGGEKDVIVLDFVDTLNNMSMFLDDSWNRYVKNLLCVALSRARKKLIIVAHTKGFRAKYGKRKALAMRILGTAYRATQHAGEYKVLEGTYRQAGAA